MRSEEMAEFSRIKLINDGTVLGEEDLVLEDFYTDTNQLALLRDLATDESKFNEYLDAREETVEETGDNENYHSYDDSELDSWQQNSNCSKALREALEGCETPDDVNKLVGLTEFYDAIKGDKTKAKNFTLLKAIKDTAAEAELTGEFELSCNTDRKDCALAVKNLGGSGLYFSIKDDMSFVLTNDEKTLKNNQMLELVRFYDEMGLSVETAENGLMVEHTDGKKTNFMEEYQSYKNLRDLSPEEIDSKLQEARDKNDDDLVAKLEYEKERRIHDNEDLQNADDNQIPHPQDEDDGKWDEKTAEHTSFQSYFNAHEGVKNPSIYAAKKALIARSGIMRIDKKCIRKKRMPDGSYVIALYDSESDLKADGKLGKDGVAKVTKKVAFRLYNTKPPKVGIYVPQGKKFETAYAKGALKALKEQGYNYFVMPNAMEFGGDAQGAFWEAAGDQLVCPRLKRGPDDNGGCDMGNDHLEKLLKAINDKNADDSKDVLLYKMRLAEELKAYNAWKKNSKIGDRISALEGDIKYKNYSDNMRSLKEFAIDGINGANGNKKWDKVDVACYYEAMARLTEGINKGYYTDKDGKKHPFPQGYNFLGDNLEFCKKFIETQMKECKGEVVGAYKELLNKSKKENNIATAGNELIDAYKRRFNQKAEDCQACGSDAAKGIKVDFPVRDVLNPPVTYNRSQNRFDTRALDRSVHAQTSRPPQSRGGR